MLFLIPALTTLVEIAVGVAATTVVARAASDAYDFVTKNDKEDDDAGG